VSALLFAHHAPNLSAELTLVLAVCGWMLLWGAFCWLSYVAFEPHVRRLWPRTLVSWTRVLDGRVRDALVGRDVLIGVLAGVLATGAAALRLAVDHVTIADALTAQSLDSLRSVRHLWSRMIFYSLDGLEFALGGFFMLLFLRLLLRRTWLAAVALIALNMPILESGWTPAGVLQAAAVTTLFIVVVLRVGLLAGVTMSATGWLLTRMPLTLDLQAWYVGSSAMVLLALSAVAIWAFTEAARRPVR
jgi:serine/threonine-protein kinase